MRSVPVVGHAGGRTYWRVPTLSAHFHDGVVSEWVAGSKYVAGGFGERRVWRVDRTKEG